MSTQELMEEWGRRYFARLNLKVPEGTKVRVYDETETIGGCDTCGYGGDTAYTLVVEVPSDTFGFNWRTARQTYEGSFVALLDELLELKEELDA